MSWILLLEVFEVMDESDADLLLPSSCGMFWRREGIDQFHAITGVLGVGEDHGIVGDFDSHLNGDVGWEVLRMFVVPVVGGVSGKLAMSW